MNRSRLAALLLFAAIALPLWAADPGDDELESNAHLLVMWKADPPHYERLQHDWQQFHALPPEKQAKMRQLEHDLHELESDPDLQKHLWETLERYANWLDHLPEAERQQILAISDKRERLKAIKLKRQQQAVERLPAKDQEYLKSVPEEERPAVIAKLLQEDHERRQKCLEALNLLPDLRPGRPKKLEDFPPEVIEFVHDVLTPMLTFEQKEQLKNTQGWPDLAQRILLLSKEHLVLPPPVDTKPIVRFEQLPEDTKKTLLFTKQNKALSKHENRWPEYALAVVELASKNKLLHIPVPKALGACRPREFPPETREFLEKELIPALTPGETDRLRQTEGQWPAYPKMLHELAKTYNLVIPGMSLPGSSALWESARAAMLPEVPDHELRTFLGELSHDDLRRLNLSPMDPSSRDRIRQEYFRWHPGELNRLHDLEQHKGGRRMGGP